MRRISVLAGMMAATAALAGCASPGTGRTALTPPPGLGLPLDGRVLVQMSQPDLDRKLVMDADSRDPVTTDIVEGRALDRAAEVVLGRAFRTVATNRPTLDAPIVARITGKARYVSSQAKLSVTCVVDAVKADGTTIGYFFNTYRSALIFGMSDALPGAFEACLNRPVQQLIDAPAVRALAAAGFPAPDRVAADAYLRSQGFVVAGP
jgi:hypothetical protein